MSDLERMICGRGRAVLPWKAGTEPIRRGPDTQAEIDRCLTCPYPECVNCLSRTESGRADGTVGRPEKASSLEIYSAWESNLSAGQIAAKLGVSKRTVYRKLSALRAAGVLA